MAPCASSSAPLYIPYAVLPFLSPSFDPSVAYACVKCTAACRSMATLMASPLSRTAAFPLSICLFPLSMLTFCPALASLPCVSNVRSRANSRATGSLTTSLSIILSCAASVRPLNTAPPSRSITVPAKFSGSVLSYSALPSLLASACASESASRRLTASPLVTPSPHSFALPSSPLHLPRFFSASPDGCVLSRVVSCPV